MSKSKAKRSDRRISVSTVRMLVISIVIVVFTATFAHSIAWGRSEDRKSKQTDTSVFITLDTQTLDGQPFTHDEFGTSRLTLVNVWETTCPACLGEMPDLQKISEHYDPSEFRIVGVCADAVDQDGSVDPGRHEKAIGLMKDAGVTFTNLLPSAELSKFIRATVAGFPTSFFVDSEGNVVDVSVGAKDEARWKAYIDGQLSSLK